MFDKNSYLVRLWTEKVKTGEVKLYEVPKLFNLYEEVEKRINVQ